MKALYISIHEILEYYECSLLTEMGHDVFSIGAFSDPKGHKSLKRPAIEGMPYYPEWERMTKETPRTNLPKEFFDEFDVIIWMDGVGQREAMIENWPRMKHKPVVWRSIGQSWPDVERMFKPLRDNGLKVVRYSPKEANIQDWIGADAMIRFFVDKNEYQGWVGDQKRVINMTQDLKNRGASCYYNTIIKCLSGFDAKVYGPGNNNLGNLNGGELPYDLMKGQLRSNRVFVYGGTHPASYTLAFIEAWVTGIPIVGMTSKMAQLQGTQNWDHYEIPDLIDHGKSGFIGDSVDEMRGYIKQLLDDDELAKKIGKGGRDKAVTLFDKNVAKREWTGFLKKL